MHKANALNHAAIFAALTFAASLFAPGAVARQQNTAPASEAQVPAMQAAAIPAQPPQAGQAQAGQQAQEPQVLHLLVGRSLIITSPTRIKRVSLADPNIADVDVVTPFQVVVNGKSPGGVSLILWDETGQSQSFEVSVDIDVLGLAQKIHEVFPSEPVQIETSGDMVMLSGKISSPVVANKILEVVKNSVPKVTSLMEVPSAPQAEVMLQVRFAEVNRQAIQELGANLFRTFGSNMPMSVSTQQFSPPSLGSLTTTTTSGSTTTTSTSGQNTFLLSDLLNIFIYRPDINLGATIQALEENNVLQILAEPNLVTQSGKEASFLAGGQFPYPVVQSVASGTSGAITIQFKEYGIRLNFTPTVTADGLIHLKVEPEVSSLDYSNAVTLQGFTIPALQTDRVESDMDLTDGQSFAIAGLLNNQVVKQFSKIPGIGDIPILGKLFQSWSLNKSDNELLVVVTPHIVHPLSPSEIPQGPAFPIPFMRPVIPPGQKSSPR
ncbi:MAG TPA: type II and III secretion system protein family protein [Candidatus Acidoferrum sp.]|nr:type II and III secretion system protein family protein [Candidatus Acidoferrum sp.]